MDNIKKESKKIEVNLPENVPINYTFEKLLKTFIKKVEKEQVLQEIKKRKYYIKPSEIKRLIENRRRKNNNTGKNRKRRRNT